MAWHISGWVVVFLFLIFIVGILLGAFVGTGQLIKVPEWLLAVLGLPPPRLPNHLRLLFFRQPGLLTYAVTYTQPSSFQRFTMVYDPSVVSFDAFEVQKQYRAYTNPRGIVRQTTKGVALPTEPGKMEIHLASSYNRPGNTNKFFIAGITVRFFAVNREKDASFLQKFNAIRSQAEFRMYVPGGTFRTIRKDPSSPQWNQDAFTAAA